MGQRMVRLILEFFSISDKLEESSIKDQESLNEHKENFISGEKVGEEVNVMEIEEKPVSISLRNILQQKINFTQNKLSIQKDSKVENEEKQDEKKRKAVGKIGENALKKLKLI